MAFISFNIIPYIHIYAHPDKEIKKKCYSSNTKGDNLLV